MKRTTHVTQSIGVLAIPCLVSLFSAAACGGSPDQVDEADQASSSDPLSSTRRLRDLGKKIFFDQRLSEPQGQSCASCHAPGSAFTDPDHSLPVSRGATPSLTGSRSAPSAAYAQFSPAFAFSAADDSWKGGQFWDGRASSLEDQAKGPLLNPLEMANPSKAAVIAKIQSGPYAKQFRKAFGVHVFDDVEAAYDDVAHAIAMFERTATFAPFTSKYDAYLQHQVTLSDAEERGRLLFADPAKGNCAACHPSVSSDAATPPLFTDFTYDNLGVPKNPNNPFYGLAQQYNPDGNAFVDHGLANTVKDPKYDGHFKVPTLRNVAITAPYMHNGYFATLRDVVQFYNNRDVAGGPPAEIPATMNRDELGNLGLTDADVDDIVAFLGTLTDGYFDANEN